jgi:hypothetical protein
MYYKLKEKHKRTRRASFTISAKEYCKLYHRGRRKKEKQTILRYMKQDIEEQEMERNFKYRHRHEILWKKA